MTTDHRDLSAILRFAGGSAAAVMLWFASIGVLTLAAEPMPNVMVFAPPDAALSAIIGSDSLIVEQGYGFMVARGQKPGFVLELYRAGAWLVLPSSGGGCARSAYQAYRSQTATR